MILFNGPLVMGLFLFKKNRDDAIKESIDLFLSHLAPATQKSYKQTLKTFSGSLSNWAGLDYERIAKATTPDVLKYLQTLRHSNGIEPRLGGSRNLSNSTIRQKCFALKSIYDWLLRGGYVTVNPLADPQLKLPALDDYKKRDTEILQSLSVKKLLNAPDRNTREGIIERAMFALFFGGGLRREEVARLLLGDIGKDIDGVGFVVLRRTKAGRDEVQPLPRWAFRRVQRAARLRRKLGNTDKSTLLGLSSSTIYRTFLRYAKKFGLKHITPHSARATAITILLGNGTSYREVQEFSRHSSISMVEHYDKRRFKMKENAGLKLKF